MRARHDIGKMATDKRQRKMATEKATGATASQLRGTPVDTWVQGELVVAPGEWRGLDQVLDQETLAIVDLFLGGQSSEQWGGVSGWAWRRLAECQHP